MDFGTILLIVIFAIIGGIIFGALYTLLSIMWSGRKAKREFKQGKIFEVKENPTQEIKQKRLKVPKEEIKDNRNVLSKLFGRKDKEKRIVKEDRKITNKLEKENSEFQKKWGSLIDEKNQFTGTEEQYKQLQKDYEKLEDKDGK